MFFETRCTSSCCNIDIILTDFDNFTAEMLLRKQAGNQKRFIFQPNVTGVSALLGGKENPEIVSLKSNVTCCFANTQNTLKYHLVTAEPPFIVKTINCMHQTGTTIVAYLSGSGCP